MDLAFTPWFPPEHPGPLERFLPPLGEGAVLRRLRALNDASRFLLDPFGVSPRLAIEAARSGKGLVVASNNPVSRFVLEHSLRPFSLTDLQSALARLSAAPKDDTRLEPFLLDLYRTECSQCGKTVHAEYFVWDRELGVPILKAYLCGHCNHAVEEEANAADRQRALQYARSGLQRALALERVAPAGDPDRHHAELALEVYPARALYALVTLLNKYQQLDLEPELAEAAQALLLSAFDAANAMWGHPEGRSRPLKLAASPRFREVNLWMALERAVSEWAMDDPHIPVRPWAGDQPPAPGEVAVFPGPVRELIPHLPRGALGSVVTVFPRPNQAYWTLSALWAAWLWGREAAASIKIALHRRRYDWNWHAGALRSALRGLASVLPVDSSVVAFVPEAEPGFLAAVLAALDGVGFRLTGRALRLDEAQAILEWSLKAEPEGVVAQEILKGTMKVAIHEALLKRGEPVGYPLLHVAAWSELANRRLLGPLWRVEGTHPLTLIGDELETVLADSQTFARLGKGAEPERGLYWLTDPAGAMAPLSDRVEALVLECLRQADEWTLEGIDERVCEALPGLSTPDRRLILACLRSYATEDVGRGFWRLRPEDAPDSRAEDCGEIVQLLSDLGARLGFSVEGETPTVWCDENGEPAYTFHVMETAAFGEALAQMVGKGKTPRSELGVQAFVLPGGRASLVAEKARRDPRLRSLMEVDVRVVKFRHVRRLAAETTLRRENLEARLALDPPEHHDPQLPLL